jgi:AcrR family transcriptional regulator
VNSSIGRPAQRGRTRSALLDAAATLIAKGLTPTTTEVADAARVSRRTAYRYFPTQEQLLVESSLERLRPQVEAAIESVEVLRIDVGEGAEDHDVELAAARLDATVRIMHRLTFENEHLLRTIQRLTAGGATTFGVRPRGSRRLDWLTAAVEPIRARVGPELFARLISALATCVGFDSFFVLRDVRGLSRAESERVTRWMAQAMVRTCVADAAAVAGKQEDESSAGVA